MTDGDFCELAKYPRSRKKNKKKKKEKKGKLKVEPCIKLPIVLIEQKGDSP
jgi:hypothetical protein